MYKSVKQLSSFSLIEVLIFVTVLSIFFVIAASVVTSSLQNMKVNEHKIIATHYAEELMAWLKAKKEMDWNQFAAKTNSTTSKVYCFNTVPPLLNPTPTPPILNYDFSNFNNGWPGSESNSNQCAGRFTSLSPNIYDRQVSLSDIVTDNCETDHCQILVKVEVKWKDLGNIRTVPIQTILSVWEK